MLSIKGIKGGRKTGCAPPSVLRWLMPVHFLPLSRWFYTSAIALRTIQMRAVPSDTLPPPINCIAHGSFQCVPIRTMP